MDPSADPHQAAEGDPVAVFVHVHYVDVWDEMAALLADRMAVPFRLIITSSQPSRTLATPRTPHLVETTFIETENRGRDIRPFLTAFGRTSDYTIGLKLHTKRSVHRLQGDAWRRFILDSLVPSRQGVSAIVAALARDERNGLVAPEGSFLAIENWLGRNERAMTGAGSVMGIDIDRKSIRQGYFAAGSMFWFRRDALVDFGDPRLLGMFEAENGQVDGTLAHALERLFAFVAEYRGYVAMPVDALAQAQPEMTRQALIGLSRSRAGETSPFLQGPPPFIRFVNRHFPFVRLGYQSLPPRIRRGIRNLFMR